MNMSLVPQTLLAPQQWGTHKSHYIFDTQSSPHSTHPNVLKVLRWNFMLFQTFHIRNRVCSTTGAITWFLSERSQQFRSSLTFNVCVGSKSSWWLPKVTVFKITDTTKTSIQQFPTKLLTQKRHSESLWLTNGVAPYFVIITVRQDFLVKSFSKLLKLSLKHQRSLY